MEGWIIERWKEMREDNYSIGIDIKQRLLRHWDFMISAPRLNLNIMVCFSKTFRAGMTYNQTEAMNRSHNC